MLNRNDGPQMLRPARRTTLAEDVMQQVVQLIISGSLRPGDKLPSERELIRQLGVSRAIVREALQSLQTLGVLEIRQGIGAFVAREVRGLGELADPSLLTNLLQAESLRHVNEIRWALEVAAAGLAAERAGPEALTLMEGNLEAFSARMEDPPGPERGQALVELDLAFHRAVAEASGNPFFSRLLETVAQLLVRGRELALSTEDAPRRALAHHQRIFAAIRARDPLAARAAMEAHIAEAGRDIESALGSTSLDRALG